MPTPLTHVGQTAHPEEGLQSQQVQQQTQHPLIQQSAETAGSDPASDGPIASSNSPSGG